MKVNYNFYSLSFFPNIISKTYTQLTTKNMCINIFQKIIKGIIPANIVYQDKHVTAFYDINPIAPIHILVVPNFLIRSTNEINNKNKYILGNMIHTAVKISKKLNIDKNGYRLIINCNKHGGQEIQYLHLHLVGGKQLNKIL